MELSMPKFSLSNFIMKILMDVSSQFNWLKKPVSTQLVVTTDQACFIK